MKSLEDLPISSLIAQLALGIKSELNGAFQAAEIDITTDQWAVLKSLWQADGISQSELAEKTNKDKASITRILDIMEKTALLKRCNDVHDRRRYHIFLTDKGKGLELKARQVARTTNQHISQNLDAEELMELRRLLLKMANRKTL